MLFLLIFHVILCCSPLFLVGVQCELPSTSSSALSRVASEDDVANCFLLDGLTPCSALDLSAWRAITGLHKDIDVDSSGDVDLHETSDFVSSQTPSAASSTTDAERDPSISVTELWNAWLSTAAHSWSTRQVVTWLKSVGLSDLVPGATMLSLTGQHLPSLVQTTSPLLDRLGATTFKTRQLLRWRISELILFGTDQSRLEGHHHASNSYTTLKDYLLVVSLGLAALVFWMVVEQNRKHSERIARLQTRLHTIQTASLSLTQLSSSKSPGAVTSPSGGILSSSSPAATTCSFCCNLPEIEEVLKGCHLAESESLKFRRASAEKELNALRVQCDKLGKKRVSLLGAFRVSDAALYGVDKSLLATHGLLLRLKSDFADYHRRWGHLEQLFGSPLRHPAACVAQMPDDLLHSLPGFSGAIGTSASVTTSANASPRSSSGMLPHASSSSRLRNPKITLHSKQSSTEK